MAKKEEDGTGEGVIVGLILSAIWIGGWYYYHDGVYNKSIAAIQSCPTFPPETPKSSWLGLVKEKTAAEKCADRIAEEKKAASEYRGGWMLGAFLSSLFFIMPGAVSIGQTSFKSREQKKLADIEEQKRLVIEREKTDQETAARKRQEALERADKIERQRIFRAELINKLGSVADFIGHLSNPDYGSKIPFVKQLIIEELRGILTKYDLQELKQTISAYEEVRIKIKTIEIGLKKHSIESDDAAILVSVVNTISSKT